MPTSSLYGGFMKFRHHRGGLKESMKTLVTLEDRNALVQHLREYFKEWFDVVPDKVKLERYGDGPDTRIGWDKVFIVTIDGFGPVGFTDGPC